MEQSYSSSCYLYILYIFIYDYGDQGHARANTSGANDLNVVNTECKLYDKNQKPIVDSGASHSVTNKLSELTNVQKVKIRVRGVVSTTFVTRRGTWSGLPGGDLHNVLYMENAPRPLLSVPQLIRQYPGQVGLNTTSSIHTSNITGERTTIGPVTNNRWYRVHQLPDDSACVYTMKKLPKAAKKRAKEPEST